MGAGRILVGEFGRPHGVRGLVKLRSFTAVPGAIASYGPLTDAAGVQRFGITLLAEGLARVEGIADRDAAARLTGIKLYVERDRLPPPADDEFYFADLIGLRAESAGGQPLGVVRAVEDHDAGAFLVIEGAGELLLPFTRAAVPVVDLVAGRLVCELPGEIVVAPPARGVDAPADDSVDAA